MASNTDDDVANSDDDDDHHHHHDHGFVTLVKCGVPQGSGLMLFHTITLLYNDYVR